MRIEFGLAGLDTTLEARVSADRRTVRHAVAAGLCRAAQTAGDFRLAPEPRAARAALAARRGDLRADIVVVISNHTNNAALVADAGHPVPSRADVAGDSSRRPKPKSSLLREYRVDAIVLARYMQVLSSEFLARYPAAIINIHHSFLPAFVGANPVRGGLHPRRQADRRHRPLRQRRARRRPDHRSGRAPRRPPPRPRRPAPHGPLHRTRRPGPRRHLARRRSRAAARQQDHRLLLIRRRQRSLKTPVFDRRSFF